jgi:hypothetical protein
MNRPERDLDVRRQVAGRGGDGLAAVGEALPRGGAILTLCVAAALLSCDAKSEPRCTIVTDGTQEIFVHERAHCLGWEHPPFEVAYPPKKFRHDFPGRLTVIPCGGSPKNLPKGTVVVKGCKSALKMCRKMWAERGIDMSANASSPNWNYVSGCQFFE